jgi:hypothetical protein
MVFKLLPKINKLSLLLSSVGLIFTAQVNAAVHKDARGNIGYDTAAECDVAVQNGTAKFYQPVTKNKPSRQKGEKSVKVSLISDLGEQYRLGACDKGVGKQNGRQGVDRKLQGKYVPFSPSMPLNTYLDASGKVVRVSMQICDNRFSAALPRAVTIPPPPPVAINTAPPAPPVVVAPPTVVVPPPPPPEPTPVVVSPPTPAPAPAPAGITPYVFGSVGAQSDKICYMGGSDAQNIMDKGNYVSGQVGAGVSFNELVGAELYVQAGANHKYTSNNNSINARTTTVGARMTLGTNLGTQARIFGKLGVANVNHNTAGESQNRLQPVVGLGVTYDITPAISIRGDFDHYLKRSKSSDNPVWGRSNYLGAGVQFKF